MDKKKETKTFLPTFDKRQKKIFYTLIFILIAILIYETAIDIVKKSGFWFGLLQNFFPDLVIVTGIGLYFTTWQRNQEKENRKDKILELLFAELAENNSQIVKGRLKLNKDEPIGNLPGMHFEYWDSLSRGGELKWIVDSPELIQKLSICYQTIRAINHFEIKYIESCTTSGNMQSLEFKNIVISGYDHVAGLINEILAMKELD